MLLRYQVRGGFRMLSIPTAESNAIFPVLPPYSCFPVLNALLFMPCRS